MAFTLMPLPYAANALSPVISAETLDYHHGRHHAGYVNNLNRLTEATALAEMSLDDVILATIEGPIFNNAAQVWNHDFYWNCMTPKHGTKPGSELSQQLSDNFGSFDEFRSTFIASATSHFGSGWTWLVQTTDGALRVLNTANAHTPLVQNATPLLVCDVWEHAYYLDYRNGRPVYLEAWWELVNWHFVSNRFERAAQATAASV